jgi:hypothetical protein
LNFVIELQKEIWNFNAGEFHTLVWRLFVTDTTMVVGHKDILGRRMDVKRSNLVRSHHGKGVIMDMGMQRWGILLE